VYIEAASVGAFQWSDRGDDGPFDMGEYMMERGLEGEVEFDMARVLIFGRDNFWRREVCVAGGCGGINDADDIEA
jgi:hypothetical protein